MLHAMSQVEPDNLGTDCLVSSGSPWIYTSSSADLSLKRLLGVSLGQEGESFFGTNGCHQNPPPPTSNHPQSWSAPLPKPPMILYPTIPATNLPMTIKMEEVQWATVTSYSGRRPRRETHEETQWVGSFEVVHFLRLHSQKINFVGWEVMFSFNSEDVVSCPH